MQIGQNRCDVIALPVPDTTRASGKSSEVLCSFLGIQCVADVVTLAYHGTKGDFQINDDDVQ